MEEEEEDIVEGAAGEHMEGYAEGPLETTEVRDTRGMLRLCLSLPIPLLLAPLSCLGPSDGSDPPVPLPLPRHLLPLAPLPTTRQGLGLELMHGEDDFIEHAGYEPAGFDDDDDDDDFSDHGDDGFDHLPPG